MTRPRWAAGSHCSQPSPSSHSLLSHSCLRCHKNVRCSIFCTNTSWILTELWRLLVQQVTYQENIKIRKYLQKAKRHLNHLFLYFNGIPVNSSKKKILSVMKISLCKKMEPWQMLHLYSVLEQYQLAQNLWNQIVLPNFLFSILHYILWIWLLTHHALQQNTTRPRPAPTLSANTTVPRHSRPPQFLVIQTSWPRLNQKIDLQQIFYCDQNEMWIPEF